MSYEDLMRLAMFDGNDDTALVRFRHAVKHARAADAQIAALTERLRAVEAERDEAIADAREANDVYYALIRNNREAIEACGLSRVSNHGSLKNDEAVGAPEILTRGFIALRAELQRKDAALKEERKYHEERIDVSAGLTLANHKNAITRIDMALQPKEPPCKS